MIELILIFISLLMVGACGIFVASEFSLIAVNRNTVDELVKKGDRRALGVSKALKTLSTQLSGAQVGITITNLIIGFLAEPAIASLIRPGLISSGVPHYIISPLALGLGIAIATIFTMLFGELIPKNFAISKPLATAKFIQKPQLLFSSVMRGPIHILNGSANFALRRFGISPKEELASARTADELLSLVKRSAEKGTLPKETARMVERSLNFGELTALDAMTPRVQVDFIQVTTTISEVLVLAKETGHSRFPVIGETSDDIKGIVHIKQAVGVPRHKRAQVTADQIMKPPVLIPSSILLESLLEALKGNGMHMAIVIDEFGGVDGVVTIEDLMEELVGEVHDEHDTSSHSIKVISKNAWSVSGLLRPDEIGEDLGIFLPDEEEFETVAGLASHLLEHVPERGDVTYSKAVDRSGRSLNIELKIERMDGHRVDRIRLKIMPGKDTGDGS